MSSLLWPLFILKPTFHFTVFLCWKALPLFEDFLFILSLCPFFWDSIEVNLSHLTGPNWVSVFDLNLFDMPSSAICFSHLNCFECFFSHLSPHTFPYRLQRFKRFCFLLWYPLPLFLSPFFNFFYFWLHCFLRLFLSSLLNCALRPTMRLDGPLLSLLVRVTQIVSDRPDIAACVRSPFVGQWVRKLPFPEGSNTQIKWLVNHLSHGTSGSGRLNDVRYTTNKKFFSRGFHKSHW